MNIKDYIKSGVLEEYCLGLLNADKEEEVIQICRLFPDVKAEVIAIENVMEKLAASYAVTPVDHLRQRILNSLGFPEPSIQLDLNNLPPTDIQSNHHTWLNTLKHLIPEQPTEDFSCTVLRQDDRFAQMLIVTKSDVPEETHDNYKESFFILKGECRCTVEGETVMLGPGGFLEIPLNHDHDVKMLTPHVVAILQYEFV